MAFSRCVLLVISSILVHSVICDIRVPVYLWGDISSPLTKANPLTTIKSEDFSSILKQELIDEPFTVVFVEETLSVEDLSRRKDDGSTSFPYLEENISKAAYFPAVETPLHALSKLANPEKSDSVKLTENGLSAEIKPDSGRFLFINLKDAREGETRSEMLERHNEFMSQMMTKLNEKYRSVVGIYTAHYPSWTITESHSRSKRNTETTSVLYTLDGLMLYVDEIILQDAGNTVMLSNLLQNKTEFRNNTEMDVQMTFANHTLMLFFKSSDGYWYFNNIQLLETTQNPVVTEDLTATEPIYALTDFAYRCSESIVFTSGNSTKDYTVTFTNVMVQPFFTLTNATEFGDSFDCEGFFSVPIWSGLFVVFILLAITFYGIMMMMDIRTMDRFDDPKGKTITINASE